MKRDYEECDLRDILFKRCKQSSQRAVAHEIGIAAPTISQMLHGAPLTTRVIEFLGFERPRIFRRKEN